MLVGLVMFRDLTEFRKFDLDKGTLFANSGNPAKVRTLFPAVQGEYVSPGSNAWAVSGAHTVDGKPMLANDPHLELRYPSHLVSGASESAGTECLGRIAARVPGVITGHNDQIAWGVTNVQADVMDLYAEQLDRADRPLSFQGSRRASPA